VKRHLGKEERDCPTFLPPLRHVVETRLGVSQLQPKPVMKVVKRTAAHLRYASKQRQWVRLGTLQSFFGTAIATTFFVPQAQFCCESLFAVMRPLLREASSRSRRRDLRLGQQALSDLKWWAGLSKHALLEPELWPPEDDAVLYTNASITGWGAA